eukprot:CAMPEP_0172591588 /NCGR_PEP_ID=MMETSP1068-20121228/10415_1 /TAXON_ID=35684 /ORGANISM="Pseudopedinella elastica, Strain CCMP716" /LENGTH=106 /DNA_ID=CAMNT_0013388149 /DNA_START=258 /DNA_END=578 /DNA_ORIENTATION=+
MPKPLRGEYPVRGAVPRDSKPERPMQPLRPQPQARPARETAPRMARRSRLRREKPRQVPSKGQERASPGLEWRKRRQGGGLFRREHERGNKGRRAKVAIIQGQGAI